MTTSPWIFSLRETEALIPKAQGSVPFHVALNEQGAMAGLYAPGPSDLQQPHVRPELYVVARGSGFIVKAGERRAIQQNDVIYVEAGAAHRFEDYSADLALWVVFWSPTRAANQTDTD